MSFLSIHSEGGLIPGDILEAIGRGEAPGQQPADFGLAKSARLADEIAGAWAEARDHWARFNKRLQEPRTDDTAVTITRREWMLPLLLALDYDISSVRSAVIDGSTYAISHRAGPDDDAPPIHIAGCGSELDRRGPSGGPRLSPHALVQEYLNRSESLWGIASNGYRLRLLRDSALMTRPAYVEFDLRQMLEGDQFADFALFYRLVHRSRLPRTPTNADAASCWLEKYYQQAVEQGGRVREHLRDGVEAAIKRFGGGFLRHPASDALRRRIRDGSLTPLAYYRQLLRLIYRLLFLMVSEERRLVGPGDAARFAIYQEMYSVNRLRERADDYIAPDERHADLWQGLLQTFRLYEDGDIAQRLGMGALDGDLFGPQAIADLYAAGLYNGDLLWALRHLSLYQENRSVRRVNYAALDVEELGSVYESLLDYHPVVEERNGALHFDFVLGSERKTTGSYYTRPELVQELIKSALEPVLANRLAAARTSAAVGAPLAAPALAAAQEAAILNLKVCDPASGSGHFLLAAARRLGRELARARSGEEHPGPSEFRQAVRDVIRHCIYGVDKNPLAVDLCKVALWLEGHNEGLPLTFLDNRIKHGDSLVGVLNLDVLADGIPDDAYAAVTGDDKAVASALKRRNKQERESGQLPLGMAAGAPAALSNDYRALADLDERTAPEVQAKAELYESLRSPGSRWRDLWTACNLWTYAFLAPLKAGSGDSVPTTAAVRQHLSQPAASLGTLVGAADGYAAQHPFFHWPLEFPDVFDAGGFDVVLCNPPWERIKLQEQEFFAARDAAIAGAPNKAAREVLISALPRGNSALWREFQQARHDAEAASRFLRGAGRQPLTGQGDINTYSVFAELFASITNSTGRAGAIVPTGIVTDDTNKDFFAHLVRSRRLVSVLGFENEAFIFPDVHNEFKFCAITASGAESTVSRSDFAFFCRYFSHTRQDMRHFALTGEDLLLLNPNTKTCPIFRTRIDADLTRNVYGRIPVLLEAANGQNPWGVSFLRMLDMAMDSHLFYTKDRLLSLGSHLSGNRFIDRDEVYVPVYEAKMIWQYDHRFASLVGRSNAGSRPSRKYEGWYGVRAEDCTDLVLPQYWVASSEVDARLHNWRAEWLLGFRRITGSVLERTFSTCVIPRVGTGHNFPVVFLSGERAVQASALFATWNSLPFDYFVRQKLAGATVNFFVLEQLPVLPPTIYMPNLLVVIVPRVLELVYTAWDIKPFADDVWSEADAGLRTAIEAQWQENVQATGGGHANAQPPDWLSVTAVPDTRYTKPGTPFPHPPFKWDEERRAVLRAELDALYAKLYGLTEEELRYILDPKDVYGPDFPGETFRVLKEKEIRQYGEYRTRRLVMEAWGRMRSNWDKRRDD